MKLIDLKDDELKIVNKMYENYLIKKPEYKGDSLDFITKMLSRCEKCGKLLENDNLEKITLLSNNKEYNCCFRCKFEIEWENYHTEEDEYE